MSTEAHGKPAPPEGTIELATTDPTYAGYVEFTVDSQDPDLFIHLEAYQNGALVYHAWQRWYLDQPNHGFTLSSPAWNGTQPAQGKAILEDWANYYRRGDKGIVVVDTTEFEISAGA